MSTITWLQIAAVGIVFGAAGQLARTIVGFKKLYDFTDGVTPAFSLVDGMRLFVSIAIGGVAGLFAAVSVITNVADVSTQQLLGIAAAGYAGSDFIEGFVTRFSGAQQQMAGPSVGGGTAASDDAVG
jgi:hypothetical protein